MAEYVCENNERCLWIIDLFMGPSRRRKLLSQHETSPSKGDLKAACGFVCWFGGGRHMTMSRELAF